MLRRLLVFTLALGAACLLAAKLVLRSRVEADRDEIDLAVVAGRRHLRPRARPFIGATVLVVGGSAELDLRRVSPAPTGIEVAVTMVLGHLRLVVPPTWNVAAGIHLRASLMEVLPAANLVDAPWLRLIGRAYGSWIEVVARSAPVAVAS